MEHRWLNLARSYEFQALFCRRRHQPRRPAPATIRPGRPAPATLLVARRPSEEGTSSAQYVVDHIFVYRCHQNLPHKINHI
jgi:hypothetical protein